MRRLFRNRGESIVGAVGERMCLLAGLLFLPAATCIPSSAQTELSNPHGAGCGGKGGGCDKAVFLKTFADAKTFAVVTRPMDDQMGAGQVTKAIAAMGKTVQPEAADLTFVLVRINTDGVFEAPAGTPLATLRVFKGGAEAGGLIWTETFSGQTDMPWPNVVNSLVQQFRGELPKPPKR